MRGYSKHYLNGNHSPFATMSEMDLLPEQRYQLNIRRQRAKLRATRKAAFLERCSIQAKAHKAMRIIKLQGKNGHSMNAALLKTHGLNAKGDVA